MRNVRSDKITFADFCVQYLEVKKNTLSPQTYNFYSKIIDEELMPMFARLKMKDLRTYHIQQFVQHLATEKKRLDGREGGIAASTVKRSIYKLSDGKAREKEPKSKCSIRTISIPERLCKTLAEYRLQQNRHIAYLGDAWRNLDYVFTEEDGYVMNPQTPTKQFDHFLKRHGIRHLKFHGLRHTSATMLLANGCDIKTVSSRIGHADITTTNIYVHALESTDRMAAQTFDKLLNN